MKAYLILKNNTRIAKSNKKHYRRRGEKTDDLKHTQIHH
jgi:hypothetical protein